MEGANRYPLLLSPYELRGRRLRNRIVSTPHATGWSRDGLIDRREVDYHVRKAAGGLTKRAMVTDIRPAREGWPLFQKAPNLPAQSSTGSAA